MTPPNPFFDGIVQRRVSAGGTTLEAPGFYRDLHMMFAVLTADRKAARALLPSDRFRTLSLIPGRALIGVTCFEYRESPVGPYREVGISIGIRVDRRWAPRAASVAASAWTSTYDGYVVQLPVNTEVALRAGIEIFAYPKFLADIAFREDDRTRTCEVRDPRTGALLYSFEGEKLPTRGRPAPAAGADPPDTTTFRSYPILDGRVTRATMRVRRIEHGARLMGGRFRIVPGDHERSRPLADLDPGRVLQYVYAPRCEAILYEPERI